MEPDKEKLILRNIIKFNNDSTPKSMYEKFSKLVDYKINYSEDITRVIKFVNSFNIENSGLPHITQVESYFREIVDPCALQVLEEVKTLKPMSLEDFENTLKVLKRNHSLVRIKGAADSLVEKLMEEGSDSQNFSLPENLISDFMSKVSDVYEDNTEKIFTAGDLSQYRPYLEESLNLAKQTGGEDFIPSGVAEIDQYIGQGIRRGNLSFVCGFAGAFKTGACVNWAVNAMNLGYNVLYITMENSATELMDQIISCHSSNVELFGKICSRPPCHSDIGSGELTPEQENLVKVSLDDYRIKKEIGDYGTLYVHQPRVSSVTLSYIINLANRYNTDCNNELDMLVIDSPNLMTPEKYNSDSRAALNDIIRGLKVFAQSFNKGLGISLLCPHQINREGHERAKKDENFIYDHKCVADLNEVERSADLVLTLFSDDDDLRNRNEVKIQFLKTRHHGAPKGKNFPIYANLGTRRWASLEKEVEPGSEGIDYDELSEELDIE